jgi:phosphatidylglycerol lysyltransferase
MHGYLRRFGTNSNSFLIRYAGDWRYFFGTSVDGVVCYVRIDRTAVAWGDPLCAPDDAHALLREFLDSMRDRGLRTALLVLQEEPARVAMALGCSALNIGAEPSFDLATWRVPRGDRGKKLRWCLNHGRRAGVRIEEYRMVAAGRDPNLERRMQEVQRRWEAGLGRSVIRSFLGSNPMAEFESKRIFLAWRGDRLEAFLACSPVHGRDGWYLEDLVRLPDATNGATELLVVTAMERLRDGGSRFATLGIAPLHGSDEQMDRRARWLVPALRAAFEHFDHRYRFATLSRYKAKFGPSWWERRYAAFSPPRPSIGTVRAVMAVLDPSPEPEPFRERPAAQRLVLVQVLLWLAASALVLTPDHLAGRFEPSAGFLAPVGAAGLAVAALLYVAASRLARAGDSAARFVLVGLEAVLVIGAVVRIRDGRWAPMEVVIAAVAAVVAVLLVTGRPAGTEDGREPARGETIG